MPGLVGLSDLGTVREALLNVKDCILVSLVSEISRLDLQA